MLERKEPPNPGPLLHKQVEEREIYMSIKK